MRILPNRFPKRVVALGGGTGLPVILGGLRQLVRPGGIRELTAIVTMSDDGGSSGRLRKDRGVPPPGDVRNCIVALATERELLSRLFQYRYDGGRGLNGHSLGNLILTALSEQTGSFLKAVERSSEVLRTVGRVLPVTLEDIRLVADFADGSRVLGETEISRTRGRGRIRRISVNPASVHPTPGVLEAVRDADLVVLAPGSLYTSLLPNIVIAGMGEAIRATGATRVMIGNLASEPGEGCELGLADQVEVVADHAGGGVVDALLVNDAEVGEDTRERYRHEGIHPLHLDPDADLPLPVIRKSLLAACGKLRHDPRATAEGVMEAWRLVRRRRGGGPGSSPDQRNKVVKIHGVHR